MLGESSTIQESKMLNESKVSIESPKLTGQWRLNLDKCTSQSELLKEMGRKWWETSVINKAHEDFCLFHFQKEIEGKKINYFEKFVSIYLDSVTLKILSKVLPIEIDRMHYTHKFVANNKEKQHEDDQKRFGPCQSRTITEANGFIIRWYLKTGVLKVYHFVNPQNQLQVDMEFTSPKKIVKATKVYDRIEMTPENKKRLETMSYKTDLV